MGGICLFTCCVILTADLAKEAENRRRQKNQWEGKVQKEDSDKGKRRDRQIANVSHRPSCNPQQRMQDNYNHRCLDS